MVLTTTCCAASGVHANFVEYTPYAIILIALLESLKAPGLVLHALGGTLLAGRVIHAYALSQSPSHHVDACGRDDADLHGLGAAAVGCITLSLPRPM